MWMPDSWEEVPKTQMVFHFFFRVRLYVFFVLFSTRPKTSCTPFSFEAQHVAPAVATHHNQYTIKFDLFVLLRSIQFIGNCFQNEHFINSHVHSPINHTWFKCFIIVSHSYYIFEIVIVYANQKYSFEHNSEIWTTLDIVVELSRNWNICM